MHRRILTPLMATAIAVAIAGPAVAQGIPKSPVFVQALPNPVAILVSWGSVVNAVGYNLYRRTADISQDKALLITPQPHPLTFLIDAGANNAGLPNGTPLFYSVKAVFNDGGKLVEGPASKEAVATPQQPILGGLFAYEIGTNHPSSLKVDGNILTVSASGGELWDNEDSGTFIALPVTGNYRITVKVLGKPVGGHATAAKAGVMIRETLVPGDRYSYLFVSSNRDPEVLYEGRMGILGGEPGNYSQGGTSLADTKFPIWLRLVKAGATFTAFQSFDGTSFDQVGDPQDYGRVLPNTYVGLGLTALKDGSYTTAQFDLSTLKIE